ncbi:hypothetical protein CRENBAI_014848 [Crenichthys baileyi]|uniref:Uncharacterized protein n=1 Tax=Crenichthys baileyi TaxID=28760 RepID=A0AAV9SS90_9TELE
MVAMQTEQELVCVQGSSGKQAVRSRANLRVLECQMWIEERREHADGQEDEDDDDNRDGACYCGGGGSGDCDVNSDNHEDDKEEEEEVSDDREDYGGRGSQDCDVDVDDCDRNDHDTEDIGERQSNATRLAKEQGKEDEKEEGTDNVPVIEEEEQQPEEEDEEQKKMMKKEKMKTNKTKKKKKGKTNKKENNKKYKNKKKTKAKIQRILLHPVTFPEMVKYNGILTHAHSNSSRASRSSRGDSSSSRLRPQLLGVKRAPLSTRLLNPSCRGCTRGDRPCTPWPSGRTEMCPLP